MVVTWFNVKWFCYQWLIPLSWSWSIKQCWLCSILTGWLRICVGYVLIRNCVLSCVMSILLSWSWSLSCATFQLRWFCSTLRGWVKLCLGWVVIRNWFLHRCYWVFVFVANVGFFFFVCLDVGIYSGVDPIALWHIIWWRKLDYISCCESHYHTVYNVCSCSVLSRWYTMLVSHKYL